jgi:hypothetical protein
MINYINDPINAVIDICDELYPDLEVDLQFVEGMHEKVGAFGETFFPDEKEELPKISIDVSAPFSAVLELIAHEVAHVVSGPGHEHDDVWESHFDAIHKAYCNQNQPV